MNLSLQRESIKYIFSRFGLFFDPKLTPISPVICNESTKIADKLSLTIEDEIIEKDQWIVELWVAGQPLRAIMTDLSENSLREFAVVFQYSDFQPYGLRLSEDPEDFGTFMHRIQLGSWLPASVTIQAQSLVGIHNATDISIDWIRCVKTDDLLEFMSDFMSIGE